MTPRRSVTLLFFLGLVVGCASLDPGPPPVETEPLARLIADLHLAQSLVSEIPIVIRDSMQGVYYEAVLAEHGYTRQSFDSVMWLVRQEPVWVDTVYTRAGEMVASGALDAIAD